MWFTRFFIPALDPTLTATTDVGLRWLQFREQILTALLRMVAVLSIPALLLSVGTVYQYGLIYLITLYFSFVAVVWLVAIRRSIAYRTRVLVLLVSAYLFAVGKFFGFGYSEDAYGFLVGLSLLSLLFLGERAGVIALLLSVSTLFGFGWSLSLQLFTPIITVVYVLMPEMVVATCLLFLAIVGGLQISIAVLFRGIEVAWRDAQQAREELERRVALRTNELALAHQEALSLSQYRTEQNQFLAALNQTAIDLLRSQDRDTLLQSIVVRAAELLDAPYGQLLLLEDQRLIVHATTANQQFLIGSEAIRTEALTSWKAIDSAAPIILSDYQNWPYRRPVYDAIPLHAIANFPILIEQRCLGVLALGRTNTGYTFDADTIQKGQLFSQLVAVVLQNRELYTTALHEIRIRREAEEQLRSQNAELDAFAHTVAHDLKNPLSALLGNTQLLQLSYQQLPPAEVDTQFETIISAGMKMNTIIEALLMLSSLRLQQTVQHHTLDMGSIVEEVLYHLQSQIQQSHAHIHLPKEWPATYGYAPWVEEVWINYLTNALKYGGTPPLIEIGADQPIDGIARFWVQDNGVGITAEQQGLLFTPFTRLSNTHVKGHGLGLSIVQRIVAKLGGEVGVESYPGHGSRFFFTLPIDCPKSQLNEPIPTPVQIIRS